MNEQPAPKPQSQKSLAPPGAYNYRLAEVDLRGNTVRWAVVSKLHQWRIQHAERSDHRLGTPLVRVFFDERYQVRTTTVCFQVIGNWYLENMHD